ncbi:hypothetical protein SAMN05444392_1188 [Seinonella peptonophila]|uniref:Uncharacterized protein n=1 Tax=Seinonella peptonophila TaxID=112248 RepID=A0A1M5B489_9BACL|nr:hypothetical protein [Seinonella peptonophila]SHF37147.1 hypothetical protein SAMN05444392_1188 [Seinonella peptonophila]
MKKVNIILFLITYILMFGCSAFETQPTPVTLIMVDENNRLLQNASLNIDPTKNRDDNGNLIFKLGVGLEIPNGVYQEYLTPTTYRVTVGIKSGLVIDKTIKVTSKSTQFILKRNIFTKKPPIK